MATDEKEDYMAYDSFDPFLYIKDKYATLIN